MAFFTWLRNRNSGSTSRRLSAPRLRSSRRRPARSYRPRVERLEARELLALINLTVTVTGVGVADAGSANFFAAITIDGVRQESPREFGSSLFVNWPITQQVDDGAPIPVEIELLDEGQGPLDIDPKRGDKTILLSVDPLTGIYNGFIYGDLKWPQTFSDGVGGDGRAGNLTFSISIPGVTTDQDGDGLLDGWERSGIDLDIDRGNGIDLPLPGANPLQKDLFVEVDAMVGRAPLPLPTIFSVLPTTPITVISRYNGLSTGTRVTLSGISGTSNIAALNGNTFTVTRQSDARFTLDGTTGGGTYVSGGAWSLTSLVESGLTATGRSLDLVVDAFLRAPVSNPDGSTGISLHVELDELALPLVPWTNDADGDGKSPFGEDLNANGNLDKGEDANSNKILDNGDGDDQGGGLMYSRLRTSNFGTAAERSNPAAMQLKALTYRYGPFIDTKVDSRGDQKGVNIGSSGMAYSASSFMVSLGAWSPPGGLNDEQAGTFMHELGHTLGLGHGGGDGVNNKPNYFSVMNYTWTDPERGDSDMQRSWRLDYSIGNFPTLDETALNESVGIGGMAGRFTRIGSNLLPTPSVTPPTNRVVPQTGPVDWNNTNSDNSGTSSDDGDNNPPGDNPVSADINFDGATAGAQSDFNDWGNIRYGIASAQAGFSQPEDLHFTYEQFLIQSQSFIYHSPSGNGADNLTLRKSSDDLELVNDTDGAVLLRLPFNGVTFVNITGANFEDDRLTIAFAGGNPIPGGGVHFDGGAGAIDTLAMTGTPLAAPRYVPSPPAGPEDGRLEMGGSLVQFTGLEFVRPVAPEITSFTFGPATINENEMVSLSGAFLDAGSLSSHSITINWGDGQVEGPLPMAAGARTFTAAHRYRDDNPSITTSDTYSVTFTLTDDDLLTGVRTPSVLVNNVRPTLQNVAVTPQIDENGVVTLSGGILDPGTQDAFALVVNWGEGQSQTFTYPAGTTSFSETHRYRDDNPTATTQDTYDITLDLSDDDSGADTAALKTLVKNVDPVITAFTSDAVECGDKAEGNTVHVVGAFTDVGTEDKHIGSISWGDGVTTRATIVEGAGSGSIAGEHIYASGGMFRIVVTLTDDDTGQTTARTFALITGVGILDGQLQIVGTKRADDVTVNLAGNGWFKVHASFLADSPRSLPAAGVTSIAMILCDGDDRATVAGNVDLPTYINGEEGDDQLNGGRGPNILLGGDGNDRINGGSSHDILVGGPGADRIVGNGGDDILIAGTLGGSSDPIDVLDELFALLSEWSLDRDRARIRSRLLVGGDTDADTLTGSAGLDWFFCDSTEDKATDGKNEPLVNIG